MGSVRVGVKVSVPESTGLVGRVVTIVAKQVGISSGIMEVITKAILIRQNIFTVLVDVLPSVHDTSEEDSRINRS